MRNDKIKKGDLVKGIISRGVDELITIDTPLKVWSKIDYDGIIVEIPKGFVSKHINPWLGEQQAESIIRECNLSPDKLYYYFNKWVKINRKEKMNI